VAKPDSLMSHVDARFTRAVSPNGWHTYARRLPPTWTCPQITVNYPASRMLQRLAYSPVTRLVSKRVTGRAWRGVLRMPAMIKTRRVRLINVIIGSLARQYSTAAVLLHHAVAEQLGLGPTDTKCLDLLRDRPAMTGSELAAVTGLTTGAITGVVGRLEKAGYVRREPHPEDGRKQILHPVPARVQQVHEVVEPLRGALATLLSEFDEHQLDAIARFLTEGTEIAFKHAALLRAQPFSAHERSADCHNKVPV
jgi:DNA-binding MarR family transcriptional regulator